MTGVVGEHGVELASHFPERVTVLLGLKTVWQVGTWRKKLLDQKQHEQRLRGISIFDQGIQVV